MQLKDSDTEHNYFKYSEFLSVDIETKDPLLLTQGPGTHRGDGHICGVSFSTKVNGKKLSKYYSLTHPDTPEEKRKRNAHKIREVLKADNPKIGANISYDLEWLDHEGYTVNGKKHDVQYAEPLLNEYRNKYSLNNLANVYDLDPKKTNVLKDYCDTMGWEGEPISHIWRMPEAVAAEYATMDTDLPLDIFAKQKPMLERQDLYTLYELETDLIPVLLRMRKNGVRLDRKLLQRTALQVAEMRFKLQEDIYDWAGQEININSVHQIAKVFDRHGIPYPRREPTPTMKAKGQAEGNPNLDKMVLFHMAEQYPICKKLLDYRHYNTLETNFLHKYTTFMVNDRIYCQFHPLRNDDYGTVSGRFSSSSPNMQQVSAKKEAADESAGLDALKGRIVRKLFIPEDGKKWAKLDYSQVEYRLMAHFATGKGNSKIEAACEELRESYRRNKEMDYHQRIMDDTGFERRIAKSVNFGGMYGIGQTTASKLFGWSLDDTEVFLTNYHRAAPYIKSTRSKVSEVLARRSFIRTLLNRRARLHSSRKPHSFFNRLIQGSAADVMKKGMVDADKQGLFDELDLHLTVHDELDVSYEDNKAGRSALRELKNVMEKAVKLDVPLLVDVHTGDNWADAD